MDLESQRLFSDPSLVDAKEMPEALKTEVSQLMSGTAAKLLTYCMTDVVLPCRIANQACL